MISLQNHAIVIAQLSISFVQVEIVVEQLPKRYDAVVQTAYRVAQNPAETYADAAIEYVVRIK